MHSAPCITVHRQKKKNLNRKIDPRNVLLFVYFRTFFDPSTAHVVLLDVRQVFRFFGGGGGALVNWRRSGNKTDDEMNRFRFRKKIKKLISYNETRDGTQATMTTILQIRIIKNDEDSTNPKLFCSTSV